MNLRRIGLMGRCLAVAAAIGWTAGARAQVSQFFRYDAERTAWNSNVWATVSGGSYTNAWASWNDAVFEDAGGSVTLGVNQSANSVTFDVTGCMLTGNTLTLGNPDAYWLGYFAADGCTGTVSSTLANSGAGNTIHIGKPGYGGRVTLNGNFAALTSNNRALTVETGTLYLATANTVLAASTGPVTIQAGATLAYEHSGIVPLNGRYLLGGSGTLAKRGAGNMIFGGATAADVSVNFGVGALIDLQAGSLESSSNNRGIWTNNFADINVATGATFKLKEKQVYAGAVTGSGIFSQDFACTAPTLTVGRGDRTGVFSGAIRDGTNPASLNKVGGGMQTLSGTNTFSGNVSVTMGVLRITGASGLGTGTKIVTITSNIAPYPRLELDGSGGDIILPAGISFNTSGANTGGGVLWNLAGDNVVNGPISLTSGNGNTKIVSNGGSLTLGGNVTATTTIRALVLDGTSVGTNAVRGAISNGSTVGLPVTKLGSGTWALSGANTYTGATTIGDGILQIGGGGTSGSLSTNSAIVNNATLRFNRTNTITQDADFAGGITGIGMVAQAGTGTVVLNTANTYQGGTLLADGYITAAHADAFGTGTVTLRNVGNDFQGLTLSGGIAMTNNLVLDMSVGRNTVNSSSSGANELRGPISIAGNYPGANIVVFNANAGTSLSIARAMAAGGFTGNLSLRGTAVGRAGFLTDAASVTLAAGATLDHNGTADWTIASTGNTWGLTAFLSTGGLVLGANHALPAGARVQWIATSPGALDLGGFDQTVAGLDAPTTTSAPIVTNSAAGDSTLTLAGLAADYIFAGAIADGATGTVSVVLNSEGRSQTLAGVNTYSGDTTVTAGMLVGVTGGSCANSAVTVAAGATNAVRVTSPGGQWSCAGLTYASGGTAGLVFDFGSHAPSGDVAPLRVNGDWDIAGALEIHVRGGAIWSGTYPLITYTGVRSGSLPAAPALLPPRTTAVIVEVGSTVYINVTSAQPLTWQAGDGEWDTATENWKDADGVATAFADGAPGDSVRFDDAPAGAGPFTVALTNAYMPGSVTVDATKDYAFTGGGRIQGADVALRKQNAGTLTVDTANTFGAGTRIEGGAVVVTNTGALGGGAIANDGELVYSHTNAKTVGNAISGGGTVTKRVGGTLTITGANSYGGLTTVAGGKLQVNANAALGSTVAGTKARGGPGALSYLGSVVELMNGRTVSDEALELAPVAGGDGGTLYYRATLLAAAGNTATWSGPVTLSGGDGNPAQFQSDGALTVAGPVGGSLTNAEFWIRGSGMGTVAAAGVFSIGATVLGKQDAGTWTISSAGNTWGETRVYSGTLVMGVSNALPGSALCTVGNGTAAATLKLNGTDQTVAGIANSSTGAHRVTGGSATASILRMAGSESNIFSGILGGTGANDNNLALVKLGAGTQTLGGNSTMTGSVTIDQGVLAYGVNQTGAPSSLLFGAAAGSVNIGTLDLTAGSLTAGGLNARNNNATANTVRIGNGKTLTLTGGLTVGGDASAMTTLLNVTGATAGFGSLAVSGGNVAVSRGLDNGGNATLNLTGLATFSYANTNGTFAVAGADGSRGTVTLAANNTITASALDLGRGNGQDSRGVLTLGAANTLNVNSIYVGTLKSSFSQLNFAVPGGMLTLAGATAPRANLYVGYNINTGGSSIGVTDSSVNWNGSTVNAMIGTLEVGYNNLAVGQGRGTLSFNQGSLDVTAARVGYKQGATGGAADGTLNIGGGSVTAGAVVLAGAASTGASTGTLNLTGGMVTLNGNITTSSNGVSTLTLAGATLDMSGHDIGSAAGAVKTFVYSGGLLKNVGIVYGGIAMTGTASRVFQQETAGEVRGVVSGIGMGLAKTGAGALSLAATNTYTGDTTVEAGVLDIVAPYLSATSDVYVAHGATMGLHYEGTNVIRRLYIGGSLMPVGVYGDHNTAVLTGTGYLQTAEGRPAVTGAVLTVR